MSIQKPKSDDTTATSLLKAHEEDVAYGMGLSNFWANITAPRVREITPRKNGQKAQDGRPATSSGVRTIRRTPSLDDDGEDGGELNTVESLLTTNIIEPPQQAHVNLEERKMKRRSRGLSLSRSRTEEGVRRRKSLFGGSKDAQKEEHVPDVPTLPTLSAIYSSQAPHHLNDIDRPSTAISAISPAPSNSKASQAFELFPAARLNEPAKEQNANEEVFELPAELPPAMPPKKPDAPTKTEKEEKKSRRRSLGEVLTGKKSAKVTGREELDSEKGPPVPALPARGPTDSATPFAKQTSKFETRSRRNSNASVASKASKMSRKSKRKSWWQRSKAQDEESEPLPPMPTNIAVRSQPANDSKAPSPVPVDLSAFSTAPATKPKALDDDAASIRTTRSQKATARSASQPAKAKKRPQSTVSHTRRRRKSWWSSSNPDDSDSDDEDASNPLPPIPLLVRSTGTTPDSSPTNSEHSANDIHAPRPLSTISAKARTYTPRSAAKSFLVSTTPVADPVCRSVRRSLHQEDGGESERGSYCLSVEQQREWEKLKHLMAVMGEYSFPQAQWDFFLVGWRFRD